MCGCLSGGVGLVSMKIWSAWRLCHWEVDQKYESLSRRWRRGRGVLFLLEPFRGNGCVWIALGPARLNRCTIRVETVLVCLRLPWAICSLPAVFCPSLVPRTPAEAVECHLERAGPSQRVGVIGWQLQRPGQPPGPLIVPTSSLLQRFQQPGLVTSVPGFLAW